MKKKTLFILAIIALQFFNINHTFAQQQPVSGKEWNFVLGDWLGEGSGKPGEGEGWFTFKKDLDGNVLIRKGETIFPATNGKPASTHSDLMVIYLDNAGALTKAIYFDNEKHVINYAVSFNQANNTLVFTSEPQPTSPRFRLTYKAIDDASLSIDFEIAMPNQPDTFKKYISGKAHRRTDTKM